MKYARLDQNSVVVEVFQTPAGASITDCFTPDVAALFTQCPDNVEVHHSLQNGQWATTEIPAYEPPSPIQEVGRGEPTSIPTTQV